MEKDKSKKAVDAAEKRHLALIETVRKELGSEVLDALGKQPLAIAAGGVETVLQTSCKAAAGHPDPVQSAVALTRVGCGSRAVPKLTKEDK